MFPLLLLGCIEFTIDPVDPDAPPDRVVVEDSFVQSPQPAVDLLFVVDDTSSMRREQSSLAGSFWGLAGQLDDEGIRWQAGVVTTDMDAPEAGWLRGSPWIVTSSMDDAAEVFADNARVGTEGSGAEAGIAAALLALELSSLDQPNAGFRRADAALHIVFVSDSDDQSDDWLGPDPVSELLVALEQEETGTGLPARASAIVGDVPLGCTTAVGNAAPGFRYREAADATEGAFVSICDVDFSEPLARMVPHAVEYPDRFELRALPVDGTLRVTVDDVRQTFGWSYEPDDNAVVFEPGLVPRPRATIVLTYLVEVSP